MRTVSLGRTGITTPQNAFGALPIQRVDFATSDKLLRRAFEGGMTFFDTARAYSDSEEKLASAFRGMRDEVTIATKTMAKKPQDFWDQLETSLRMLQTDHIDLYQFHCINEVWRPDDGSGMYECMLEARQQGKILHFGVTAHKIQVAFDAVESGLYETMQFPLSYLSGEREEELVRACEAHNMGFIAMKGVAGGLITNARAAMAYMAQFPGVVPIWGVQREEELEEWLSFMDEVPTLDTETAAFIAKEREELQGEFCRGCGYCLPCPQGIQINQCARMALMARRAPRELWWGEGIKAEMDKIPTCIECGVCASRCPYSLDVPNLLKRNYADYQRILAANGNVAEVEMRP